MLVLFLTTAEDPSMLEARGERMDRRAMVLCVAETSPCQVNTIDVWKEPMLTNSEDSGSSFDCLTTNSVDASGLVVLDVEEKIAPWEASFSSPSSKFELMLHQCFIPSSCALVQSTL